MLSLCHGIVTTKDNYLGRWNGLDCNICGLRDTDEHIMSCPGYCDIVSGEFRLDVLWDESVMNDMEKLSSVAKILLRLIDRIENVQNMV